MVVTALILPIKMYLQNLTLNFNLNSTKISVNCHLWSLTDHFLTTFHIFPFHTPEHLVTPDKTQDKIKASAQPAWQDQNQRPNKTMLMLTQSLPQYSRQLYRWLGLPTFSHNGWPTLDSTGQWQSFWHPTPYWPGIFWVCHSTLEQYNLTPTTWDPLDTWQHL